LLALLITGRVSDHLGRKPVILAAIAAEIAAMACFIAADSTTMLCVARAAQGLATGCALGALSAALAELPEGTPTLGAAVTSPAAPFGLAAGGLGSSVLVQYGPAPLRLVYWLIIAALVAGAAVAAAMREPGQRRPGGQIPGRLGRDVRGEQEERHRDRLLRPPLGLYSGTPELRNSIGPRTCQAKLGRQEWSFHRPQPRPSPREASRPANASAGRHRVTRTGVNYTNWSKPI
jgi:MFS family permease